MSSKSIALHALQERLVAGVDLGGDRRPVIAGGNRQLPRPEQGVLRPGDLPEDRLGIDLAAVGRPLSRKAWRIKPQLVGGGIDGEVPLVAEETDLLAQDPHAEGVEGGEDHPLAALFPDQVVHPLLHLAGRLVGEGDRQDVLRRHTACAGAGRRSGR